MSSYENKAINMPKKIIKSPNSIENIIIKGARLHNLKNIDVQIPRNSFTVITGVSGSGKSTLAFDTLYAEGQRRYVESLSSYARQFMGKLEKPEVDYIHGISPAIAIEQKVITRNPRSTVGTTTEIYDYLKVLFARLGKIISPKTGLEVKKDNTEDILSFLKAQKQGTKGLIYLKYRDADENQIKNLILEGYSRVRIKDEFLTLTELSGQSEFDLIIDRFSISPSEDFTNQVLDSLSTAFNESSGDCWIDLYLEDIQTFHFCDRLEENGDTYLPPSPDIFNFNSPIGACPTCEGFGKILGISEDLVIPNKSLSVFENCVAAWKGEKSSIWRNEVVKNAHKTNFPVHTPYKDLTRSEKNQLWSGSDHFKGIQFFFDDLQKNIYKIQNRVMLSRYKGKTDCNECNGNRLRREALAIKIGEYSISDITKMTIDDAFAFIKTAKFTAEELKIGKRLVEELTNRLAFLSNVGVGYISLSRLSNSLSGGESQRVNLASRLGSSLVGSLYVLDEPSIGLHPKDTQKLIKILRGLNKIGNTVVVVEHDEEIMKEADYIIDIGPKAGIDGGEVVFEGNHSKLRKTATSLTAKYLKDELSITPTEKRTPKSFIKIVNCFKNNLSIPEASFPLNCLHVVTGVSGSGKSSLIKEELLPALTSYFSSETSDKVSGDLNRIDSLEFVDQNPIGKSSRSSPVTYVKAFDEIRNIYAQLPASSVKGFKPSHFSLNVPNGRCEKCQGEGDITIEMQFMADLKIKCDECKGQRFKDEVLQVEYNGKNISDILKLSIDEAVEFFKKYADPSRKTTLEGKLLNKLLPLQKVGLGYVKLGQPSSTLSGGEAQRVKLAYFLIKGNSTSKTFFIFDEPTTGLHFHDINLLLKSFYALIDQGHSVLVIEHNPEVMKCADWISDLGPGGGKYGGKLIYSGPPEKMKNIKDSATEKYLQEKL